MQLYSIEEELAEDFVAIDSFATDTINAAYEYNNFNNIDEANNVRNNIQQQQQHNNNNIIHQEIITKFDNYSMVPMDILKRAGVDVELGFVPSTTGRLARLAQKKGEDLRQQATLPSLEEIQSMYGNHSYIVGLERCDEYRNSISPKDRIMGPAGMFNSATNLLNRLLKINCVNQDRVQYAKDTGKRNAVANSGMLLQAPWGKHNPVSWRLHHEAKVGGHGVQQENFLPIVMIKDPITWMASMCRHPYEARWRHGPQHCPNLVPNRFDRGRKVGQGTMGIKVKFATKHIGNEPIPDNKNKTFVQYDSLLDLWNTWYHQWYNATFPRLMVRYVHEICSPCFQYLITHNDSIAQNVLDLKT